MQYQYLCADHLYIIRLLEYLRIDFGHDGTLKEQKGKNIEKKSKHYLVQGPLYL